MICNVVWFSISCVYVREFFYRGGVAVAPDFFKLIAATNCYLVESHRTHNPPRSLLCNA